MQDRLWGLDLVRTLAVMLVLVAHSFQALVPLGFWGVEIFFALSGYLIGGILLDEISSKRGDSWGFRELRRFWLRRWLRTLPNYYFYLGLAALFATFGIGGAAFSERGGDWRYVLFLQNLWPGAMGEFYGVSWSLTVEEWFYLTFPFLIWCMHAKSTVPALRAFFLAAMLLCAGPIVMRFLNTSAAVSLGWDTALRKVVPFRLDAILWGVLAAYGKRTGLPKQPLALAGICILFLGGVCDYFNTPAGFSWWGVVELTLVPMGVAALLPAIERWQLRGPIAAMVSYVSRISYSLYLCHALVIGVFVSLEIYQQGNTLTKFALKLVQFTVIVVFASATYAWVEKPFLRLRERVIS